MLTGLKLEKKNRQAAGNKNLKMLGVMLADSEMPKKYKGYCQRSNSEGSRTPALFGEPMRDFLSVGVCGKGMFENHADIISNLKTRPLDNIAMVKWMAFLINTNSGLAKKYLNWLQDKKYDEIYEKINQFLSCAPKKKAFLDWIQTHADTCKRYNEKFTDNDSRKNLTISLGDVIQHSSATGELTPNKQAISLTSSEFTQVYIKENPKIERLFNGGNNNNFIYVEYRLPDSLPPQYAFLTKSRDAALRYSEFSDQRAQEGVIHGALEWICMKKNLTRDSCEQIVQFLFNRTDENYISLRRVNAVYLRDAPGYPVDTWLTSGQAVYLGEIEKLLYSAVRRSPLKEFIEKNVKWKYPDFQIGHLDQVLGREVINYLKEPVLPPTRFKDHLIDLKALIQFIDAKNEERVDSLLGKLSGTISNINDYYDQRTPLGATLEADCNCKIVAKLMARGARYDIPQLSHRNQTIQMLFWKTEGLCDEVRDCVIPQLITNKRVKRGGMSQIEDRSCGDKMESKLFKDCEEDIRISTDLPRIFLFERIGVECGLGVLNGFIRFIVEKLTPCVEQRYPEYNRGRKSRIALTIFLSSFLNTAASLARYPLSGPASFLVDDEDIALISSLAFYFASTMGFTVFISVLLHTVDSLCGEGYLPKFISPLLFSLSVWVFFFSKDFQENPGQAVMGYVTNAVLNNVTYWGLKKNKKRLTFFRDDPPPPVPPRDYGRSRPEERRNLETSRT